MNNELLDKLIEFCPTENNPTIWSHEFADYDFVSEQDLIDAMEELKLFGKIEYGVQIQNMGRSRVFAGITIL